MDIGYAFAVSVLRQPERVALVEGPRRMTYAAWYARSKPLRAAWRKWAFAWAIISSS